MTQKVSRSGAADVLARRYQTPFPHCERWAARTTGHSNSLGRVPRNEAKQFSVERRMNEVKTALCDAIKGHAQNPIAP